MGFDLGGISGALGAIAPLPVVGSLGSAATSVYQNNANRAMMNDQNNFNANQAEYQMDFQKEMSNTAHQREVADLKAAGLNPILSANQSGASTPSGAAASSVSAQPIVTPDFMANGLSMMQMAQAQQRLEIDRQNSAASIAKNLSDVDLNRMKQILMKKGLPEAMLHGEAADMLSRLLKSWREDATSPKLNPRQQKIQDQYMKNFDDRMQNGDWSGSNGRLP